MCVALDFSSFFPIDVATCPSNAFVRHVFVIMIEALQGLNSIGRKIVISAKERKKKEATQKELTAHCRARAINIK